ncbi:MAG TPA: four helix bundle protein [Anaerolineales bacterium]|nr:four helix bundle protein [Anaerolineales bacterium]
MTAITRFEEIEAWKTARQLTNVVYALGNQTGLNRDFGLRDQIRRASISVMSNIAEGFESRTDVQFIIYLESNPRKRRVSDDHVEYEV